MNLFSELEKNRDNFLDKNPKYGKAALNVTRGVKDRYELAKKLNCHETKASTILNELVGYGLYQKDKNGVFKKTKDFIRIGERKNNVKTEELEKHVRTRKIKKINVTSLKKETENYFTQNFKEIKNPFNKESILTLSQTEIMKALEIFFTVLDSDLKFDRLNGLGIRYYESIADYFSRSRMKRAEMINSFSSLIKNFEPYIKKLVLYKTKDFDKAKPPLDKKLLTFIIRFDSNLDNFNEDYWKDKNIKEACIRYVYPFRHIEAHESRNWDIFEMEKTIYYMFASIILINLEI